MNYEQKYKEALDAARRIYDDMKSGGNFGEMEDLEVIFPELAESEDDKIRKALICFLKRDELSNMLTSGVRTLWIAYLEKQKEHKPNIELIQRSWYMEGYTDGEFKREPRWNLKAGKGGPKYEENEKYGQLLESKPAEKQDYSGLNDLERAIHRGFLAAGVEDVPVTIIKETAKECLAQMKPAEWSEADEEMLKLIISELKDEGKDVNVPELYRVEINWLKSLRPDSYKNCNSRWKPSEEQMKALNALNCHGDLSYIGQQNQLISLYNDLKKLM